MLEAYAHARVDRPDKYLERRARLAGELKLVSELLTAVGSRNQKGIEACAVRLRKLDTDTFDDKDEEPVVPTVPTAPAVPVDPRVAEHANAIERPEVAEHADPPGRSDEAELDGRERATVDVDDPTVTPQP